VTTSQKLFCKTQHELSDLKHAIATASQIISDLEVGWKSALAMVKANRHDEEFFDLFLLQHLDECKFPISLYSKISLTEQRLDIESTHIKPYNYESYIGQYVSGCANRVKLLFDGVVQTIYCFCGRIPSRKTCEKFLKRYFLFAFLDILEDKYKFHTNYLLCSLTGESELPSSNDLFPGELPGIVIGGWVRRAFRSQKKDLQWKMLFANSLLQAKRAAAEISMFKQCKSVLDHQKNMEGLGYCATETQKSYLPKVLNKIESLVKIYYPNKLTERIPVWRLPSQGGCFESSKSNYGTLGYFHRAFHQQDANSHFADLVVENEINFANFWEVNSVVDIKIPIFSFGFNIVDIMKYIKIQLFNTERCTAKFAKVLEPFKVRGITASNASIYQLGRMIQPVLHGALRREDGPFRFIGKRHNDTDINSVYAGVHFYTEEERIAHMRDVRLPPTGVSYYSKTFFVAGDYKNATDNMHPDLPKKFIDSLEKFTDLSVDWIKVLRLTLGGHEITYEDLPEFYYRFMESLPLDSPLREFYKDFKTYKLSVLQRWGQLMGSPTSFPVLNLVNAAMFWVGCEEFYGRSLRWDRVLNEFRPLFNGDDISFISNRSHYDIWKEVCAGCGLSLSPGKNYCTREFVNINSTSFMAKLMKVNNVYVVESLSEGFLVNAGLLKGQAKVLADQREINVIPEGGLGPVCDQLNELIRVASIDQRERTLEVFSMNMLKKLQKSSRSWRLPRHLGGLGLPFGSVNHSQLEIALRQFREYRDLSDRKKKGEFTWQANEYWKSIRESLPDSIDIRTPCVLISGMDDPLKDYFDLPCLSTSFMTDEDFVEGMYDSKLKKQQKKSTKEKKGKRKNPEGKFLREKRKFNFNSPTNLIKKEGADPNDEVLITCLSQTSLSGSGSNKRLRVDVCIPRIELQDVIRDEMILCQRENFDNLVCNLSM